MTQNEDALPSVARTAGSWAGWAEAQRQCKLPPPRAPSAEDGQILLDLAADFLAGQPPKSVLILGVTPQLVQLPWPSDIEIIAVDSNAAAIETSWAPNKAIPSRVELASWTELPVETGGIDLIVGDCSFNALDDLESYQAVGRECARALRPGGALLLRFFAPESARKTMQQVIAEATACPSGRLSHFRLEFALAASALTGFVDSHEIKREFDRLVADRSAFAARVCVPLDEVARVIDVPAKMFPHMRLNYFTLGQISTYLDEWFEIDKVRHPSYLMGHACPTVRLTRSGL